MLTVVTLATERSWVAVPSRMTSDLPALS